MKTWDRFYPDLLIHLPGAPEPVLDQALLRVAQDFFARTKVWKLWLDPVQTRAGAFEYEMPLEPRTELVKLERATLDGRPIDVITEEQLPADWMTYPLATRQGVFTTDTRNLFVLPTPSGKLVLRLEAVLRPSEDAAGVEDAFFYQYVDTIAKGTKARLMLTKDEPYSSPTVGQFMQEQYDKAVNGIAFAKWRGFSSAAPRARIQTY